MSERWTIAPSAVDHPDAVAVLREYMTDIASRYYGRPATTAEVDIALAEDPTDDLAPPAGALLLARHEDGSVQGCIGVRLVEPSVAELKRVYVRASGRGQGGGVRLVAAAEDVARGLGATLIRLDTRDDLVEARALYARCGYAEVAPFNADKYAEHWFAKPLPTRAPTRS
ncbi:GNAT family N-acetyltransferase [Amycolatopsis sp. NPDC059021]|uniref:GNAT family N-acetyltransferase n=1 Tax=Amycolatopsis sp. NPDC059021 TaxID=3346704 RepID=UPI00366C5C13